MAIQLTNVAYAKDYMVEVLVFENVNASSATESHAYEAPKRMKFGSKAWLLPPTMLNAEAESIEKSSNYVLKQHYSWGIESLPYEDSANFTVVERESQGYIKVYAEQLFFDHPKFGLLMQVSRLPKKNDETELTETAVEADKDG